MHNYQTQARKVEVKVKEPVSSSFVSSLVVRRSLVPRSWFLAKQSIKPQASNGKRLTAHGARQTSEADRLTQNRKVCRIVKLKDGGQGRRWPAGRSLRLRGSQTTIDDHWLLTRLLRRPTPRNDNAGRSTPYALRLTPENCRMPQAQTADGSRLTADGGSGSLKLQASGELSRE